LRLDRAKFLRLFETLPIFLLFQKKRIAQCPPLAYQRELTYVSLKTTPRSKIPMASAPKGFGGASNTASLVTNSHEKETK
jgi:hypothetical protein